MNEQQNTQQPVAWRVFRSATEYKLFISEYNAQQRAKQLGSTDVQPLYPAQPVPRDVLMAFGESVQQACAVACIENNGSVPNVNIAALADRYASRVQPEPVNQQLLSALKRLLHKAYKQNWQDNYPSEVECAESAIAAAEATQPVGQQAEHNLTDVRCECCGYLTHQREHMGCIRAAHSPAVAVPEGLLALKKELGTLRWIGKDEGWELAVEAVSKRISEMLSAAQKH